MPSTSTSTSASMIDSLLLPCLPEYNPRGWLVVNGLCVLYSAILLGIVLFGADDGSPKGGLLAKHQYLIYDWLLCMIWIVEIGVTIWHTYYYFQPEPEPPQPQQCWSCRHTTELVVALYLGASSIYFLWIDWSSTNNNNNDNNNDKDDPVWEMTFDLGINLLAYLYLTHQGIQTMRHQRHSAMVAEEQHDGMGRADLGSEGAAYGSMGV